MQLGRDLQRQLLEATFAIDSAREERIVQVDERGGDPARHRREGP